MEFLVILMMLLAVVGLFSVLSRIYRLAFSLRSRRVQINRHLSRLQILVGEHYDTDAVAITIKTNNGTLTLKDTGNINEEIFPPIGEIAEIGKSWDEIEKGRMQEEMDTMRNQIAELAQAMTVSNQTITQAVDVTMQIKHNMENVETNVSSMVSRLEDHMRTSNANRAAL